MAVTSELSVLHRAVDELRSVVGEVRSRYGDIPPVKRLLGDIDRLDIDAAELDDVSPPSPPPQQAQALQLIDDTPPDPSLWADADDEGVGGYHGTSGGSRR
jgi:hypothetical protein